MSDIFYEEDVLLFRELFIKIHKLGWGQRYKCKLYQEGTIWLIKQLFNITYRYDEDDSGLYTVISDGLDSKFFIDSDEVIELKQKGTRNLEISSFEQGRHYMENVFQGIIAEKVFPEETVRVFKNDLFEHIDDIENRPIFWGKQISKDVLFRAQRNHQNSRIWEDASRYILRSYFAYKILKKRRLTEMDKIDIESFSKLLSRYVLFGKETKFKNYVRNNSFGALHGKDADKNHKIHFSAIMSFFCQNLNLGMIYKANVEFKDNGEIEEIKIDDEINISNVLLLKDYLEKLIERKNLFSFCEQYKSLDSNQKSSHNFKPPVPYLIFPSSTSTLRVVYCVPTRKGHHVITKHNKIMK